MKNLFLLLFLSILFSSCKEPAKTETTLPKLWCWMNYSPDKNWDEIFEKMSSVEMRGLLLNAKAEEYPKVVPFAKKYGIKIHAWQWILNTQNRKIVEEHPEWLSVNREGKSLSEQKAYVDHYKFLCPILPEVQGFLKKQIEEILKIDGIDGISLDYCRFVDVILPEKLWPKYGIIQDKEYPEWDYGYHPAMLKAFKKEFGYDPLDLEDPSQDKQWKQFRYDQITNVANMLSDLTHQYGKTISASPFPTPTIARRIVRQDWDQWNLDIVFPMVYSGFYKNDGADWIGECVKEDVKLMSSKGTDVYCGFFVPSHKNDTLSLAKAMNIAKNNGASGVSVFSYGALDDEQWLEVKQFIESF
jgi:uncharacterized lipoprotein YddW (UPF0748 family)